MGATCQRRIFGPVIYCHCIWTEERWVPREKPSFIFKIFFFSKYRVDIAIILYVRAAQGLLVLHLTNHSWQADAAKNSAVSSFSVRSEDALPLSVYLSI